MDSATVACDDKRISPLVVLAPQPTSPTLSPAWGVAGGASSGCSCGCRAKEALRVVLDVGSDPTDEDDGSSWAVRAIASV